ncbi:MAG: hypothetical protein V3T33_06355 [Myxococcota bacterium]
MKRRKSGLRRPFLLCIPLLGLSLPTVLSAAEFMSAAEPMRLHDPAPRWISVRFEVSPGPEPNQLDTVYTPPLPAWLEPGDAPDRVRVQVAGRLVEQYLFAGQNPTPGSFSDFVWVFDTVSGHVLSAHTSGKLLSSLRWGFFTSQVETDVDVQMGTRAAAGFARSKRFFGHRVFRFCENAKSGTCTLVNPSGYNRDNGYVNAVGAVSARTGLVSIRTFSPLGEAIFSEQIGERQARN